MPRITTPGRQHFDRNGNPLSNGQLYTRETDGVTDKAVYPTEADATAGTNALANPVFWTLKAESLNYGVLAITG